MYIYEIVNTSTLKFGMEAKLEKILLKKKKTQRDTVYFESGPSQEPS